jgi:hypothetical protein
VSCFNLYKLHTNKQGCVANIKTNPEKALYF